MTRSLILLHLLHICAAAVTSKESADPGPSLFAGYGLQYYRPQPPAAAEQDTTPQVAVFLHAAVGIFPVKRKRPGKGDFWGFGREIMEEMLDTLQRSGLLARPSTRVYVTLLGTDSNVALALDTLRVFNATVGNIHLLLRGRDLYVAELPTIHALRLYSLVCDPRSALLD